VGFIAERDNFGFPSVIQLQDLHRVQVTIESNGLPQWKLNGEKVPADRIWHFRAYPQEQQVMGLSPIGLHMRTVGIGLAAERFGTQFYAENAIPTALLVSESPLDQAQAESVKAKFMAAVRSSRGEPVLIPKSITYQPIQIPPIESQFLETQKYTATECARIFGPGVAELLGYDTGGSLTYANVESRSLHVLIYSLNQWLRRLEGALSSPRMTPRGQYIRFNRNALLQTTVMDRYRAYELALRNKFQTVNEVRELEDWTPVAWGDEPNTGPALPTGTSDVTGNVTGGIS